MKVGIAGAGAVGCHYGAKLQQVGMDATYLARGAHLAALQQRGLIHQSNDTETVLKVSASDDASILSGCDVVIIAAKTTGLSEICEQIAPHISKGTVLMTVQNGVQAPDVVAARFPDHAVIGASAFIGARIEKPGLVIHSAAGHIRFGGWQGDSSEVMHALADAWQQAGVDARVVDDVRALLWTKLLWNIGFNAITALTRRYARDIASSEDSLQWVRGAMQEGVAVAQALGVKLDESAIASHIELTMKGGPVKTSMWQDMEHGRKTEIEAMNGMVAAEAAKQGIEAPVNAMLASLIRAAEKNA